MKRLAFLIAMMICCSCIQPERERGDVVIHFSTGALLQTKAESVPDSVADGRYIYLDGNTPDLVILIADENDDIVATFPGDGTLNGSPGNTSASVKFTLGEGNYTVYAFGNTRGWNASKWRLVGQGPSQDADDFLLGLATGNAVEGLKFQTMTKPLRPYGASVPVGDEDYVVTYMPLSAKGSLAVNANATGEVSLQLLRCVAKVTAIIKNQTPGSLLLYDYQHTVYKMFPNTGWLVKHNPDYADANSGNLAVSGSPIPIATEGSLPYSWFVFPSQGPYTLDIQFTLNKGNPEPVNPEDPPAEKTYTYEDLPITDWRSVSIPSLERNQHLTVTTRLSKGVLISFGFEVAGWGEKSATVNFY